MSFVSIFALCWVGLFAGMTFFTNVPGPASMIFQATMGIGAIAFGRYGLALVNDAEDPVAQYRMSSALLLGGALLMFFMAQKEGVFNYWVGQLGIVFSSLGLALLAWLPQSLIRFKAWGITMMVVAFFILVVKCRGGHLEVPSLILASLGFAALSIGFSNLHWGGRSFMVSFVGALMLTVGSFFQIQKDHLVTESNVVILAFFLLNAGFALSEGWMTWKKYKKGLL